MDGATAIGVRPYDRTPLGLYDRLLFFVLAAVLLFVGIKLKDSVALLASIPTFITAAGFAFVAILPIKGAYSEDLSASVALFGAMLPGLSHIYLGRYKTAMVWIIWFTLMFTIFAMLFSITDPNPDETSMPMVVGIALTAFTFFACVLDTDRVVDEMELNLDDIMTPSTQLSNPMAGVWLVNAIGAVLCVIIIEWQYSLGNVTDDIRMIFTTLFVIAAIVCVSIAVYAKKRWNCRRRETVTFIEGDEEIIGFRGLLKEVFVKSAFVSHPFFVFIVTFIMMGFVNEAYFHLFRVFLLVAVALYGLPAILIYRSEWGARKKTMASILWAIIIEAAMLLMSIAICCI